MTFSSLMALSPLDGRYNKKVEDLRLIFSEFALMRFRVLVEVRLLSELHPTMSPHLHTWLEHLYIDFDETAANHIKNIEKTTNHDVKACEYYIREKVEQHPELKKLSSWIHFGCTSDDINNLAYGMMLSIARQQVVLPLIDELLKTLVKCAHEYADIPMLSRTHGQAATPTTVGKEFSNVVYRLRKQSQSFAALQICGKMNGAVGNFNAHLIASPQKDWPQFAKSFVESLGLTYQAYTTQIEPHDYIAELSHQLIRFNMILIDFCRDMWSYISLGYFKQRSIASEVGSSTMPHKVNPIDFENAEGNLYLSNALFNCFADKLPVSRFQRDLVDSTLMRNLGVAFGHLAVAYQSILRGLQKIEVNQESVSGDLDAHWEVLAEPIQMVMRTENMSDAYEELKLLTRGKKKITQEVMQSFIDQLDLSEETKSRLKQLTPASYLGVAKDLAKSI